MQPSDYQTVAMILNILDEKGRKRSTEEMIVEKTGLSRAAVDQLFIRWAGVDLTRFLEPLHAQQTRRTLSETAKLLAACGSAAERLTGRPHGRDIQCSLIVFSSRQRPQRGAGLTIRHGFSPSPFGDCLVAVSREAICHLCFVEKGQERLHCEELRRNWPLALLLADDTIRDRPAIQSIFAPTKSGDHEPLRLLLQGTTFQLRVWQALLALPQGAMISYQALAGCLGHPTASRAVAGAVAANPIGYLIPCHRVIRKSGELHHYRWGSVRKKAMLGWEACLA
jgi:AraC family transcriptional regulator of adaptative response/methylated-DNA-[protein]-cysteine methyltransferase